MHGNSRNRNNVGNSQTKHKQGVSRNLFTDEPLTNAFGCGCKPVQKSTKKIYSKPSNGKCISCNRLFISKKMRHLNKSDYDMANVHVSQVLGNLPVADESTVATVICLPCHRALMRRRLPRKTTISPHKRHCGSYKCCACQKSHKEHYRRFNMTMYGNDNYVLQNVTLSADPQMICDTCHNLFQKHTLVKCHVCTRLCETRFMRTNGSEWLCIHCHKSVVHMPLECSLCLEDLQTDDAVKVDTDVYNPIKLVQLIPSHSNVSYLCTLCHNTLLTMCAVCSCRVPHNMCVPYAFENYDYSNYLVAQILSTECVGNGSVFLCHTCHASLQYTDTKAPHIPKKAHMKYKHLEGCSTFLKKIHDAPIYGCTICHRWMFQLNVVKFHETNYDMENSIVISCCSHRFVSKLCHLQRNTTSEFICQRCHGSLRKKKPTMPNQAVANNLELDDIPPELHDITDLERRLISLRIPFMKLCSLRKYGSHYKINGPCVNVPASLEHITTVLPRMSTEIQLHPVILKRRIDHVSEYMRNDIRRDKVGGMINWLKTNNKDYASIEINATWCNSFETNVSSIALLHDTTVTAPQDESVNDGLVCKQSNPIVQPLKIRKSSAGYSVVHKPAELPIDKHLSNTGNGPVVPPLKIRKTSSGHHIVHEDRGSAPPDNYVNINNSNHVVPPLKLRKSSAGYDIVHKPTPFLSVEMHLNTCDNISTHTIAVQNGGTKTM